MDCLHKYVNILEILNDTVNILMPGLHLKMILCFRGDWKSLMYYVLLPQNQMLNSGEMIL